MNRLVTGISLVSLIAVTGLFEAQARPQYAQKEQKPCGFCHTNPGGGGSRNFRGGFYGANGLSFAYFNEDREAHIARVEPNSSAEDSVSKVGYVSTVTAPADKAIIGRSNVSPVLVVFLNPTADDTTKDAVKLLAKSADAFGRKVAVVGVVKGDVDTALKLTADLGNVMRVLADPDGVAIAKYKAEQGMDMVVVPKFDANDMPPLKSFQGFSKDNLNSALDTLSAQGISFERPDTSSAPAKPVRGAKLSG